MYKVSKILVPVDFSDCSRAALDHALSLAKALNATVEVLHVAELPQFKNEPRVAGASGSTTLREYALEAGKTELDAFLSGLPASDRASLATTLDAGKPREGILGHAQRARADLIVMGTHGRTGRAHSFAGSVAESIVRSAPCPVLTVRLPD
jgi:nucleotide-binding universal stress UspA family protein